MLPLCLGGTSDGWAVLTRPHMPFVAVPAVDLVMGQVAKMAVEQLERQPVTQARSLPLFCPDCHSVDPPVPNVGNWPVRALDRG